jgi:hypothetical protein
MAGDGACTGTHWGCEKTLRVPPDTKKYCALFHIFDSWQGKEICLFSTVLSLALGHNRPAVQGGKAAGV